MLLSVRGRDRIMPLNGIASNPCHRQGVEVSLTKPLSCDGGLLSCLVLSCLYSARIDSIVHSCTHPFSCLLIPYVIIIIINNNNNYYYYYSSTFPHGSPVLFGLLISCMAGAGCSWYALATCRFVVLTYETSFGNFAQMFVNPGAGDSVIQYQIAAGLFSWLQPYIRDGTSIWNDGRCTGYTRLQTEGFGDTLFEGSRVLAIVSVLVSVVVLVWVILLACLSLGKWYIRLLSTVLAIVTLSNALTFLVLGSGLCTNVGDNTSCSLDEGGLVGVASVICWAVATIISIMFIVPLGKDLVFVDGELKSDFAERQALRKRMMEIRKQKAMEREQAREEAAIRRYEEQERKKAAAGGYDQGSAGETPTKRGGRRAAASPGAIKTPDTVATMEGGEGETEVYFQPRTRLEDRYYSDDDSGDADEERGF